LYRREHKETPSSIGYGYSYRPDKEEASASVFVDHKMISEVRIEKTDSRFEGQAIFPVELKVAHIEALPGEDTAIRLFHLLDS